METYVVSPAAMGAGTSGSYLPVIEKYHIAVVNREDPLFENMKNGDLVIIARGANWQKQVFFAGFVSSPKSYSCDKEGVECEYTRDLSPFVDLKNTSIPFTVECFGGESKNPGGAVYKLNPNNLADKKVIEAVMDVIQKEIGAQYVKDMASLLRGVKNLILTGAPGTGKTYLAKEIAREITGDKEEKTPHIAFVQFHPSYDYTDFVEGLRPTTADKDDGIGFAREDGVFKVFCKAAIAKQKSNFDEAFSALRKELAEKNGDDNALQLKTERGTPFRIILNSKGNLSLITGGSNQIQGSMTAEKLKSFLTDDPYEYWGCYFKGVIKYLKDEHHLATSKEPSDQKYVFIIDEINRGDIAKIFGELFFAIDPGYRSAKNRVPVKTQYQTLIHDPQDPFVDGFYVPDNVYIIGTMNDIDRNVESMDFAIRRRFTWREVSPEETVYMLSDKDHGIPEYEEIAVKHMKKINALIVNTPGLGPAYQIGASYFLKLRDYKGDFSKLWDYHIAPLLREYLRGLPNAENDFAKLHAAWDSVNQPQDTAQ